MDPYEGRLKDLTTTFASSSLDNEYFWNVVFRQKPDPEDYMPYEARTTSRIVLAVLETVLFRSSYLDVVIEVSDDPAPAFKRVRLDDRGIQCGGDLIEAPPEGKAVVPFTPTAFADEMPPKWGFFFSLDGKYSEYKGTSLDAFETIAEVWRKSGGATVILEFDGKGYIKAARPG
jgi:hypothetical protein